MSDGWGGRLASVVRSTLETNAATLSLRTGASVIGREFQDSGEYMIRARGAEPDSFAEGEPVTFDSSMMIIREAVDVSVCVQKGELGARINLVAMAEAVAKAVLIGGWQDPQFEWHDVVYTEKAESSVLVESGFVVSARFRTQLDIRDA